MATGTLTVNNTDVTIVDGRANHVISGLGAGEYEVLVVYSGDENFTSANMTVTFNVNKIISEMNITASDIRYGENAIISVVLSDDATGILTITVNGVEYTVTVRNLNTVTISDLEPGNYVAYIVYSGDFNYLSTEGTVVFSVLDENQTHIPIETELSINVSDVNYGNDIVVLISANENLSDNIAVNIAGRTYTVQLTNGKGNLTLSGLNAGSYIINAVFDGNDDFTSAENNTSFNVNKANVEITDVSVNPSLNTTVIVTMSIPIDDNVIIAVNDVNGLINGIL